MNLEKLMELAVALPDAVKQNAVNLITRMGETIEGIGDTPQTWRAPTLKLIQAMSDRSKLPKGTNIGDFLLGETVVEQPHSIIPMRSWNARQYWSPDQNETKMLCSSPDDKLGYIGLACKECPHSKFDEETKKTECNKVKVFMVISADLSNIFIINYSKTGYKSGVEWENLMKKAGVSPYRRVYGLKSEGSKTYKNVETLAIETFEGAKRDTPVEYLPFLTELFNQIGADRKTGIDEFHKIVLSRKQDPALLANQSEADSEMILIGNDLPPKEADAAAASKSPLAKKYAV